MLVYSMYVEAEWLGVKAGSTDLLTPEKYEYCYREAHCPIKKLSINFMGDDVYSIICYAGDYAKALVSLCVMILCSCPVSHLYSTPLRNTTETLATP